MWRLLRITYKEMAAAPLGPEDRLDSWKEIAAYLKRGVRTVQRWERSNGLPVRRLELDKHGTVYAYKAELDAWWNSRQQSASKSEEDRPQVEKPTSVPTPPPLAAVAASRRYPSPFWVGIGLLTVLWFALLSGAERQLATAVSILRSQFR
jgi:hypothetical protein